MSGTKKKGKPPVGEAWEEPPDWWPDKPDWAKVASTLRKNPGEWLRVYTEGRETWANAISRGRVRALHPDLGFEIKTADNKRTSPRTCSMWARFNPDKVNPLSALFTGRE